MTTATQPPVARRLRETQRRIRRVIRRHPYLNVWALTALIAAEIRALAPELTRLLTPALVRGWVTSARPIAVAAIPVQAPAPPPPPQLPAIAAAADAPLPVVRWPAIEAAVRDLMSRQVVTWAEYTQLVAEAKNTAFSVAGAVTEDGVARVREVVAKSVAEGLPLDNFARELVQVGVPAARIETVFRTQVAQAQGAGLRTVLGHPAVAAEFPYLAYHAIHDSRVGDRVPGLACPTHLMMEQLGIQGTNIYRADDPVILKFWPPWRWNCRCWVVPISIEDAAAAGIREAMMWERTSIPPISPAWVPHPPFDLPPGWPRPGPHIRPIVP